MKLTLPKLLILLATGICPALAIAQAPSTEIPYDIKNIQRVVKTIAYVDNGWKDHAPCIQVELRVTRELSSEKPFARAYFYDRDGKLVKSFNGPVQASDDHKTYTSMPELFKPKQANKVSFPISEKATQTGEKWNRVIIVFGDRDAAVAEVYPKDDIKKFEFPEKDLVLKSAPSTTGAPK